MKKKGLEILPPSLQAEVDAIKAQEDEKYRVDALMRLTRKLYMGLKPTVRNLKAIMDDVFSALCCWTFGGVEKEDSPIVGKRRDPYQEDIQWLIAFTEFVRKFDGREYLFKSTNYKIIDCAISSLYSQLYMLGNNHKYLCGNQWCRSYQKGVWWTKVSDIGLRRLWLDIIIMALADVTDLAEEWADEGSYLSKEWRKLEDELRRMAGLPSTQKPAAAADSGAAMGSDPMAKECANAINTPSAAPPTTHIVELSDESAKKVARLTGAEVKKLIKPGRGSKNTRFPNETKEACVRIWEKYKGNPEVMKLAQKRKVSHKDVFKYAKGELEEIGIHSAEEYHRAIGAASDRKHRESPAVKEKKPQ